MCCCVYDKEREKIVLFYVGDAEGKEILKELKSRLPRYMIPNRLEKLEALPFTANGKINRLELKNRLAEG